MINILDTLPVPWSATLQPQAPSTKLHMFSASWRSLTCKYSDGNDIIWVHKYYSLFWTKSFPNNLNCTILTLWTKMNYFPSSSHQLLIHNQVYKNPLLSNTNKAHLSNSDTNLKIRNYFTRMETIAGEEFKPSSLWTGTCTLLYHTWLGFQRINQRILHFSHLYDKQRYEFEGHILTCM